MSIPPETDWTFKLGTAASRDLRNLDSTIRIRVLRALRTLATNYPSGDIKKLKGSSDRLRLRVGDWRVIFAVEIENKALRILRVRRRDEAYRQ